MQQILKTWQKYIIEEKQKEEAAVAVIINEKEQILLLKRAGWTEKFPELWNLPGGGVDKGESPVEAAIRETEEECGLNINISEEDKIHIDHLRNMTIHFYVCKDYSGKVDKSKFELTDDRDPEHEHTKFIWIKPNNLEHYETIPGTENIIRKAFGTREIL
jgi:mutator protein MutT